MSNEQQQRREHDKSILTLTMEVGRLADSHSAATIAQASMSADIKDLTKTISKLDVVMEKLVNIEERYGRAFAGADNRLKHLEKNQIEGCPALRELKVAHDGKYNSLVVAINSNQEQIKDIHTVVTRIAWLVFAAVIASLLKLVLL